MELGALHIEEHQIRMTFSRFMTALGIIGCKLAARIGWIQSGGYDTLFPYE
jgi:hypothetical protein